MINNVITTTQREKKFKKFELKVAKTLFIS